MLLFYDSEFQYFVSALKYVVNIGVFSIRKENRTFLPGCQISF